MFSMNLDLIKNNKYIFWQVLILSFFIIQIIYSESLTPDSFAYLDGAKNLIHKSEYTYDANSQPITLFPPLYSILLGGVITLFGNKLLSIFIINSILYLFAVLSLVKIRQLFRLSFFQQLTLTFIFANILFRNMSGILSENIFIPLLIIWLILQKKYNDRVSLYSIIMILILELLMVTARYSGIIIIASWYGADLIYRLLNKSSIKKSITYSNFIKYLVPLITLTYFVFLRKLIAGSGSQHHFVIGSGKYSVLEYLIQIINELGSFFIGDAIAYQLYLKSLLLPISLILLLVFFCFFKVVLDRKYLIFLILSVFLNVLILYSVWVDDGIGGRYFIWFYVCMMLFAKVEIRNSFKFISKYYILILLSIHMVNNVYFLRGNIINSKKNNYSQRVKFNDYIRFENFKSDTIREAHFEYKDGKRFLISPCYRWNLK